MTRPRRFTLVLALFGLTTLEHTGRALPPPQETSVSARDLLDYYDAGEFDAVGRAIRSGRTGNAISQALRHDGRSWIGADGPDQRNHRRMLAAALALDASDGPGFNTPTGSSDLIAWARTLLMEGQPTESERLWQLGALAELERRHDSAALEIQLAVMAKRFPQEHRIALGRAFLSEIEFWDDHTRSGATWGCANPARATNALRPLLTDPNTRDEAALRLGFFALYGNHPAEAIDYLKQIAATNDAGQVYLDALFSGWAYDGLNRPYDAVREYQAALKVVPRAQTASLYLAVGLYDAVARDDATVTAEDAMRESLNAQDDPWLLYGLGDWRGFPRLLKELQASLQ